MVRVELSYQSSNSQSDQEYFLIRIRGEPEAKFDLFRLNPDIRAFVLIRITGFVSTGIRNPDGGYP